MFSDSKSQGLRVVLTLAALLLTLATNASAQQAKKVPLIGYVSSNSFTAISTRTEAFRQGLRELGYVEGKNIVIEWRSAEGKLDRLPMLAAELVRLNPDVIVSAAGNFTASVIKEATHTIPIVVTNVADPVGTGYAVSLARPGANITGLTAIAFDLAGKRLELIGETIPKLSRVAVLLGSARRLQDRRAKRSSGCSEKLGTKTAGNRNTKPERC